MSLKIQPADGRLAIIFKLILHLPIIALLYIPVCITLGARELADGGATEVYHQFKRKGWIV